MLTLGAHPLGGPARADTLIVAGSGTRRSVDGGHSWSDPVLYGEFDLYEIPAGLPHAGRLLLGDVPAFSDDRGATWSEPRFTPDQINFLVQDFLALPRPENLPGATSGRDPAAPLDWPTGRIVGVGYGGLAVLSDDGGDTYRPANILQFGYSTEAVVLVRRPDDHPLGPGPRLLAGFRGDAQSARVWWSDDAGETWVRGPLLYEPIDGPGAPTVKGLFALSEPGEADPGAGGRALAALGRGHLYQTTDGGETWAVVGRAPEMLAQTGGIGQVTFLGTAELGPDGRLYIGPVGRDPVSLWRTTEPFVVASGAAAEAPSGLSLSVQPNPAAVSVSVVVTAPAPGDAVVTVVDALGREVARLTNGPLATGTTPFALDTSGWAAGVYVVRATVGAHTQTARLVVTR